MQKNFVRKLFFIACVQCVAGLQQAYATTYYVAPSGVDTNSGTSLSTPVKTINNALSKAQLSGDIVYVLTGTYVETFNVTQSGITLSAYPNNTPVIDGGNTLPSQDWDSLIYVDGNNNTISGFEVKNSNINGAHIGGYGIQVSGQHNTISKMKVHHIWEQGVVINGDYNILEDSTVWQSAFSNSINPGSRGWSSGIATTRGSASSIKPGITSYAILRRNTVFNNWGEGIVCFAADHCTMEDNIVYDNWTTNMYLSDATNSLVQRNMVYVSSAPAIPLVSRNAILLADEIPNVPRSANNSIINNFIYNADLDAFSWSDVANAGLNNVLIANNTIVDGGLLTGDAGGNIVNTNSQIRNNIFLGQDSSVPSKSGITFSNNNWSVTPIEAGAATDIVGDPQIARTGATTPGALRGDYFKISESSPVIDTAMPLNSVTEDFFKVTRGTAPDIGGHELQTSNTSPTAPPSNTAPVDPPQTPATVNISSYSVGTITSNSAIINWTTNVPSTGVVSYGTSAANLSSKVSVSNLATSQAVQITGLARRTTYYYKISANSGSATALTPTSSFRTTRSWWWN